MITASFISELARKYQTTEQNIRREYCQHLFLSYFYQQPSAGKICFKGGTALRLVFGSPRFSEDLDFDFNIPAIKELEQVLVEVVTEINREGGQTEILEAKKTTGGYLAQINFLVNGEKLLVELNFSARKTKLAGEIVTVTSDFVPGYQVVILQTEELVAEKLAALLARQKPRDFYDFYFLLRKNLISVASRQVLKKVRIIFGKSKIDFEGELKRFLPRSHWAIIRDFKMTLEREIEKY